MVKICRYWIVINIPRDMRGWSGRHVKYQIGNLIPKRNLRHVVGHSHICDKFFLKCNL